MVVRVGQRRMVVCVGQRRMVVRFGQRRMVVRFGQRRVVVFVRWRYLGLFAERNRVQGYNILGLAVPSHSSLGVFFDFQIQAKSLELFVPSR